jgi:hypothetical protein
MAQALFQSASQPKQPYLVSGADHNGGAGCKSPHPHLPEGRGEALFLDILSTSEIASFELPLEASADPSRTDSHDIPGLRSS